MGFGQGGKRAGAGRPKGSVAESVQLREAAQKHTDEALAVLVEIMQNPENPQRLKAAEMILARGHGAPREIPATVDIITRFVNDEISAITACLMIEAEGLNVPVIMQKYFQNEMARAHHSSFSEQLCSFDSKPPLLQKN